MKIYLPSRRIFNKPSKRRALQSPLRRPAGRSFVPLRTCNILCRLYVCVTERYASVSVYQSVNFRFEVVHFWQHPPGQTEKESTTWCPRTDSHRHWQKSYVHCKPRRYLQSRGLPVVAACFAGTIESDRNFNQSAHSFRAKRTASSGGKGVIKAQLVVKQTKKPRDKPQAEKKKNT